MTLVMGVVLAFTPWMQAFFDPSHFALWLLVGGLFFPRLILFFAWSGDGHYYPANDIPGPLNFLAWAFFPRFLMAYYIYFNQGAANFWFWAYLATGLWGVIIESQMVKKWRRARRRYVLQSKHTNAQGQHP